MRQLVVRGSKSDAMFFPCVLVAAFALLHADAAKLPQTFTKCSVSPATDNQANECLRKAIEDSLKILIPGDKELGVYSLDPLDIKQMKIDKGGEGSVAMVLNFRDAKLMGLGDLQIKKVSGKLSSPKDFSMDMEIFAPILALTGDYDVDGKILVLPITGTGVTNLTINDVEIKFGFTGQPNMKNNKEYLAIDNIYLKLDPKKMYINLENLFNGDKGLGDNMNNFLNENWSVVYNELKPSVENAYVEVIGAYAKRIMERVQYKNIFLLE